MKKHAELNLKDWDLNPRQNQYRLLKALNLLLQIDRSNLNQDQRDRLNDVKWNVWNLKQELGSNPHPHLRENHMQEIEEFMRDQD